MAKKQNAKKSAAAKQSKEKLESKSSAKSSKRMTEKMSTKSKSRKLRYAVVGLGHIAQDAVLPAFAQAKKNSELTALVSGDKKKMGQLAKKYRVKDTFSYEQYDECLSSGLIDAVYIALPNDQHQEYAERAMRAGIHVLCEKPLAVKSEEAQSMNDAAAINGVKLMTAYRLHLQEANLEVIRTIGSGELGDIRAFTSTFSMKVAENNIRLNPVEAGGGPLYDIGVYCINASRYVFQEAPYEVFAFESPGADPKFKEIPEMVNALMRFSNGRNASFTCNFASADVGWYEVLGTKGLLCLEDSYTYKGKMKMEVMLASGKTRKKTFPKTDQFAAELQYFSDCVLKGKEIEPNGKEGLIDVQIIESLLESIRTGRPVKVKAAAKSLMPTPKQKITKRPHDEPKIIHAKAPVAD